MSNEELLVTTIATVKRIKIITGWPVPELTEDRNILYEQLMKFFAENYDTLNAEEIAYAMRNATHTIENWGKDINLKLIGKALDAYLATRMEISALEEQKQPITDETHLLHAGRVSWAPNCEAYYQDYLTGTFNIALWPHELYNEFVFHKMMAEDVCEDFYDSAKTQTIGKLAGEKNMAQMRLDKDYAQQVQEKITMCMGQKPEYFKELAKRMAVLKLFEKAKTNGLKNLFIPAEE